MPGSIEQRGPTTFRLIVSHGLDGDGKQRKHRRTFHGTRAQAKAALARFYTDVKARASAAKTPTLETFAADWLTWCEGRLAPQTVQSYRQHLTNRILPALGHHRLDHLRPGHIEAFAEQLGRKGLWLSRKLPAGMRLPATRGKAARTAARTAAIAELRLSPATQQRILATLSALLKRAVRRQLIARNPAATIERPRQTQREALHHRRADVQGVVAALREEPAWFRAFVLLALSTGMRRGELAALEWRDVLWDDGAVVARQSAQAPTGQGQSVKSTKGRKARVAPLTGEARAGLAAWRDLQNACRLDEAWAECALGDFVFTDSHGGWLRLELYTRTWKAFLARHELPAIPLHGVRHTAATLWLSEGMTVRDVQELLGHGQASTTLNIYGHSGGDLLARARRALEGAVSPEASPGDSLGAMITQESGDLSGDS